MTRRLLLTVILGAIAIAAFRLTNASHLGHAITGVIDLGGVLLASLLGALIPAWLALRSPWRGFRLVAALVALGFGIGSFNNIIEAVFFGVLPVGVTVRVLVPSLIIQGLLATAIALAVRSIEPIAGHYLLGGRHPGAWLVRGIAGVILYLGVYFAAGILIYPLVRSFYESSATLPTPGALIPFQLLVRGPLFVLAGVLIVRMTRGSVRSEVWLVGAILSLLGGVIPLLSPNAAFPDAVRWAHLVEVGSSNLIYGILLGLLLIVPLRGEARTAAA